MRALLLCIMLIFGASANAAEPAKRLEQRFTTIPGKALCKDSQYVCMYRCTMEVGSVCQVTRDSDRACPAQRVKSWFWVRKDLAVLKLNNRHMGCKVTSQFKTNMWCEDTEFGYECRVGPFRDQQ